MEKVETFCERYNISHDDAEELGFVDRFIGTDTSVYLDLKKLRNNAVPEFINSSQKLDALVNDIRALKEQNDKEDF